MPRTATIRSPRTEPNDPNLTLYDVSARLGITYATARKLALTGEIQFVRVGPQFRFRPSWLEAYITRRR